MGLLHLTTCNVLFQKISILPLQVFFCNPPPTPLEVPLTCVLFLFIYLSIYLLIYLFIYLLLTNEIPLLPPKLPHRIEILYVARVWSFSGTIY